MDEARKEKSSRPKARQSLAHIPTRSNTTVDIASLKKDEETRSRGKRVRGKSLGPGGLEALTETNANALRVCFAIYALQRKGRLTH